MMGQLACVLVCIVLCIAVQAQESIIINGGFEDADGEGVPTGWRAFGPRNWDLAPEAARTGEVGLRMRPSDKQQWLRQQHQGLATRAYVISGWFRAEGFTMAPERASGDHARLYVHVLYEGRPYADGLQAYRDIPAGTWDWRRFAVTVAPNPAWQVSEVWITVTSQFHAGELWCDDVDLKPAGFMGGASVLDWANGTSPVMLTDLGGAEPAEALSDRRARGRWKVLDYEIGPYTGRMLAANFEAEAPPVSVELPVEGWHAVYIGLGEGKLRVKLTSDPSYVGRNRSRGAVEEVFFKAADLTGERIHFAQQTKGSPQECNIAYVKLVPLTAEEVARLQADRADLSTRRLATSIDGFSYIYSKGPTTVEDLLEEVEEYRDSDFGVLHVCVGGADLVNYRSEVGFLAGVRNGALMEVFPRAGDRVYAASVLEMTQAGVNPTRVHIEGGKALGMKVHVSIRPGAWRYSPHMEEFFDSPFYAANPRWRCVDRDGTPVERMSLAVPQVRAHLIAVLREAVQFGADGANIIYVRGVPYVLWEDAFCDLFRERYDADAREVPEDDPRITALRVEIMTQFMNEVREMLDEEQARRGQAERLEISAFVLASEADNLKYGLDVRGWVEAGLLDEVSPYLGAGGGAAREYDLEFFAEACGERGVPWRPTIIAWRAPEPDEMMNLALRYYDAGASGITFWDGNSLTTRTDRWSIISRMGHVEELRERAEQGLPSTTIMRPHRLGGVVVGGRYSPNWGY